MSHLDTPVVCQDTQIKRPGNVCLSEMPRCQAYDEEIKASEDMK